MASLIDLMRMLEMVSGSGQDPAQDSSAGRLAGLFERERPEMSIAQAAPYAMPPQSGQLNLWAPKTQDQEITDFLMRNGTLYPRDPETYGKGFGGLDMGAKLMGMGAGIMREGEDETARRQAEANAFAQQQLANQTNMMRASQARPGDPQALLKAVSEGPGYADAALGPGGTGTAQPFTPRLNPRFTKPLPRMGQRGQIGYVRGRNNAF